MPASPTICRRSLQEPCDATAAAAARRIALDPDDVDAWTALGIALGPKATARIPTVSADDGDTDAPPATAPATTSAVQGQVVSQQRCFVEAVERRPTADEWNNVGNTLADHDETVTVNGRQYSAVECYATALDLRPDCAFSWGNLGAILASEGPEARCIAVDYKKIAKAEAAAAAAAAALNNEATTDDTPPGATSAPTSVGTVDDKKPHGEVLHRKYTAQQCFVRAVELDGQHSDAWYDLGETLSVGETVNVNGRSVSSEACFAISRRLNGKV